MNDWLEALLGWRFDHPWMLGLFLLWPLAILWRRRRIQPSALFAPSRFLQSVDRSSSKIKGAHLTMTLRVIAILCLVMALARPVQRDPLPLTSKGLDIVLCVDASSSMESEDMAEGRSRLLVAKDAASRFVEKRSSDRLGLVGFARYPDLRCPPTLDHEALSSFLGELETVSSDSPEDATGLGAAVARAAQALGEVESEARVVILLTDGEENVATTQTPEEIAPLHAAQLCQRLGVRVYVISVGYGRQDPDRGWVPLDTTQVRQLAEETSGVFFEARDAEAIEKVYAVIDNLEQVVFEEPRFKIEERFLSWLVIGMILLTLARLLESTLFEVLP